MAKMLISAGCAWVFELSCGHFLEVLKIAKQTSTMSYAGIIKNITGTKGVAGVLDGFFPWGTLQAVCKGGAFGLGHSIAKGAMKDSGIAASYPGFAEVMSGGIGGAVQGVVMSPVLLLKTRVITDSSYRATGGLVETAIMSSKIGGQVIKRDGVVGLMKGMPLFTTKRFFDWTTRFMFVELVESNIKKDKDTQLSTSTKMLCSFAGGTMSAISTIPMDVLVALQQSAGTAGKKVSAVEVLKQKYAEGGMALVGSFGTKGMVARIIHVALTTVLMKTMTAEVYHFYSDYMDYAD